MQTTPVLDEYLQSLLIGQRNRCRQIFLETLAQCEDPRSLYHQLLWPAMEQVDRQLREDRIDRASANMAMRINRVLADQLQGRLPQAPRNGKRLLIVCGRGEGEELGAQMCADLFESHGWEVYFVGAGVPNDEILALVGSLQPSILLIFGTRPEGVPEARRLIDLIRDVGSAPTMNIMVSGGVFNRADSLWEEINADLFAPTAHEAFQLAGRAKPRPPQNRIPGAPKKRRRRRCSPTLLATSIR
jgi:methanogenic corrinoid protein MtbC1